MLSDAQEARQDAAFALEPRCGIGAALPLAAFAHHSFAVFFDSQKSISLTGVVTEYKFVNPHGLIVMRGQEQRRRGGAVEDRNQLALDPAPPGLGAGYAEGRRDHHGGRLAGT